MFLKTVTPCSNTLSYSCSRNASASFSFGNGRSDLVESPFFITFEERLKAQFRADCAALAHGLDPLAGDVHLAPIFLRRLANDRRLSTSEQKCVGLPEQ